MAPADITPERLKEKILELKLRIGDLISAQSMYDDELYILQWLRVNKFDVSLSEKKIRAAQKWRDEFDKTGRHVIDLEAATHFGLHKCMSKDGRVVLVGNTKKIDQIKMFNEIPEERLERFLLNTFLDLELEMIAANRRNFNGNLTVNSANGVIVLADVASVPFRAIMTPRIATFYYGVIRQIAAFFPGALQTLIWLNAPSALGLILRTFAKFLSGPFFEVQSVTGHADFENKIHSIISPEALDGAI